MPTLIAGVVAVILLYSLLQMFRAANPVVLARAIKIGGGVVALAVAAFTGIKGELGLLKVPVFMFQEGHDADAEQAFREIARLTGGAWCRFDPGAAAQLRELLRAAAAYAAGGREALLRLSKTTSGAAKLLGQMK